MIDPNDEIAVRQARMDAAKARPDRKGKTSLVVAGMAAGSGAKLVAGVQRARDALATRLDKWESMTTTEKADLLRDRLAKMRDL